MEQEQPDQKTPVVDGSTIEATVIKWAIFLFCGLVVTTTVAILISMFAPAFGFAIDSSARNLLFELTNRTVAPVVTIVLVFYFGHRIARKLPKGLANHLSKAVTDAVRRSG